MYRWKWVARSQLILKKGTERIYIVVDEKMKGSRATITELRIESFADPEFAENRSKKRINILDQRLGPCW